MRSNEAPTPVLHKQNLAATKGTRVDMRVLFDRVRTPSVLCRRLMEM